MELTPVTYGPGVYLCQMEEKVYKNINELISIQQDRGLNIINDEKTRKIITFSNYYGIFNRYKDPFLDSNSKEEKYISDSDFDEIYELYKFDHRIKSIFFEYILMIENNVKSIVANEFSKVYGHKNYLLIDNFNNTIPLNQHMTLEFKKAQILDLISKIDQEISNKLINNNQMINHYIINHGYVPLWVLVNILSFGTISKFYYLMKDRDKNNVSKYYNIKPDQFESVLKILTEFRNACAHSERIYSFRVLNKSNKPKYIPDFDLHFNIGIPKDVSGNYVCGKNDLFSIVIVFKYFLTNDYFIKFFNSLIEECDNFEKHLKSINISKIYRIMGFPHNWKDIKDIEC